MPGTWSTTSPPTRPGAYFNFVAALEAAITSGVTGTAAIIGSANWGPTNQAVTVGSRAELNKIFGRDSGGSVRSAALAALDGFDLGGAVTVMCYRAATAAAAAGTVTLTDGTTAAITFTARYTGSRSNTWTITVRNALSGTANLKDVLLYEGGLLLDSWLDVAQTNDGMAAAVNATNSPFLTAASIGAAARIVVNVVGVSGGAGGFAGGASGDALTLTEYSAAWDALETQDFNTIALADVDDVTAGGEAILDAFAAWAAQTNTEGRRFFAVIGGGAGETLATARLRSSSAVALDVSADNANVINLGGVTLRRLSDNALISTAALAPRFAGLRAGLGIRRAGTYATLDGYQVSVPLSAANVESAIAGGVTTFGNHTTGSVRIEAEVTSLVTTNTADRPKAHKSPRNVAIDHFVERELTRTFNDAVVAQVSNTETGRKSIIGSVLAFLEGLEGLGALQPGSIVELDDRFVQTGNAVYLNYEYSYANSVERVFSTVRVQ